MEASFSSELNANDPNMSSTQELRNRKKLQSLVVGAIPVVSIDTIIRIESLPPISIQPDAREVEEIPLSQSKENSSKKNQIRTSIGPDTAAYGAMQETTNWENCENKEKTQNTNEITKLIVTECIITTPAPDDSNEDKTMEAPFALDQISEEDGIIKKNLTVYAKQGS